MSIPQELRNEVATIGRDITIPSYGGVMRVTDDTLLSRGGGRGLKIYDDIERDCHAYAVLQKRKMAVIGREWQVDPASTSRLDKRAAELVRAQLHNLSGDVPDDEILPQVSGFDAVCLNLLDSLLKGFAVGEIMWATDGAEIVAAEVRARDQRRFEFAVGNNGYRLTLKTWESLIPGEPVPPRKFVVQSFGAKDGSPHGLGLGSRLFWPCFFKRQDITFWLSFVDKFAGPTAVGKYPAGTDEAGKQKLLNALSSIASESGVIIPEGMLVEYLEAQRSGSIDSYEKLARYMDEQMSEAVLGETGSTNQSDGGGSRARDEVGNDSRLEIVKADADLQCAVLNATLVKWITLLNVPGATPPRVWRDCSEPEDLKSRADRDKIICDMGFKPSLKYITDTYGGEWTEKTDAGIGTPVAGVKPVTASFAAGVEIDASDRITTQLGVKGLPIMDGLVAPIRKLVMSAGSLEEIRDGLLGLYGEMNSDDLGLLMGQAMALGDLTGRSEVLDGD
jgi:phage gp29-like protein